MIVVPFRWPGHALPVDRAGLDQLFADVRAWGLRHTFGRIDLVPTVHDVQDGGPIPTTTQSWWSLSQRALWAVPGGYPSGNQRLVTIWPTSTPFPATPVGYTYSRFVLVVSRHAQAQIYAHELMHSLGLLHAARAGSEYGSRIDVMGDVFTGDLSTLGLSAPHLHTLGLIAPTEAAVPVQRTLYDVTLTGDALRYRDYWIECRAGRVYVHRTGSYFGDRADVNELAALDAGGEWHNPNSWETPRAIRHDGGCAVTVD